MRKCMLILLLFIVPTFAFRQSSSQANENAGDERAILTQRDALLKAYDAGDLTILDQIEADDFTLAGDFGQMTKREHLDLVRHREKPQVVTRKIDNQFRFYGDVALLTEVDHAADAGGKADYQTTTLWVRHGGIWRVVHLHYSKVAEKP
jgi:hypothetical protein